MPINAIVRRKTLLVRLALAASFACAAGRTALAGPCYQNTLPAGWYCENVGDAQLQSNNRANHSNGLFTIKGGGHQDKDFDRGHEGNLHESGGAPLIPGTTEDSFVFAYHPWSGDFEFTATLFTTCGSNGAARAGLMVRERIADAIAPNARHAFLFKEHADTDEACLAHFRRVPGEHTRIEGKTTVEDAEGGSCPPDEDTHPTRLRLVRRGDQVSMYCATDDPASSWKLVGGTTLTGLGDSQSVDVGFAVTVDDQDNNNPTKYGLAEFYDAHLRSLWTTHSTSWMANNLPGGGPRVPLQVSALYVDAAGTSYTNRRYFGEEGWLLAMIDSTGEEVRRFDWASVNGLKGGYAVTALNSAAPSDFVYVSQAMVDNPDTEAIECETYFDITTCPLYVVRRYRKNGLPSPLPNGRGWDASMRVFYSPIRGLATNQVDRVYISEEAADTIHVYDLDLQIVTVPPSEPLTFYIDKPREIAVDSSGYLWVIQNTSPPAVSKREPNGGTLVCSYSTSGWLPTAIAIHPNTGKVWVVDDDESQNIKILNDDCQDSGSSFGVLNGIYGGTRGQVAPDKLNGPVGIGFDSSGNLYVASNGPAGSSGGLVPSGEEDGTGTELRSFTSAGQPQWALYGLEGEHAPDDDPGASPLGSVLFSATKRYQMDCPQPLGNEGCYSALTLDRFRFPHDGRKWNERSNFGGAMIRRVGPTNTKLMFLTGFHQKYLGIYRFESGSEIAIPSGLLMRECVASPDTWPFNATCDASREIWTDLDGYGDIDSNEWTNDNGNVPGVDSWYVDETGDIWVTSRGNEGNDAILKYDFQYIDANGVPRYQPASGFERPEEFQSDNCTDTDNSCLVGRAVYVPSNNTMYLAGFTNSCAMCEKDSSEAEKAIGTVIYRYNEWGSDPVKDPGFSPIPLPYAFLDGSWSHVVKSFEVVGNRIYVPITNPPQVMVYDAASGAPIASSARIPGAEVAGKSGGLITSTSMQTLATADSYVTRISTGELLGSKSLLYKTCRSAPVDPDNDGVDSICDSCPTISNSSQLPAGNPVVEVTYPNGPQIFAIGTNKTLTWTATDACGGVSDVDVLISRNGPTGTYTPIAAGIPNTGSYVWNVTGPSTSGATGYIKVVARDPGLNMSFDRSNSGFTITCACQSSYCSDEGIRCTWNSTCGVNGCCNYTCSADPSCTGPDECPPNACGCF
jgi:hypothetical protein